MQILISKFAQTLNLDKVKVLTTSFLMKKNYNTNRSIWDSWCVGNILSIHIH